MKDIHQVERDIELRQLVTDELEFEPSIDASDIAVTAEKGVVTLAGHVGSYPEKLTAERAAWRVRGVRAVVQDIEVRFGTECTADEDLAMRALNVLRWDSTVPANHIHLSVHRGWITLEGEVRCQYQKANAESDLHNLAGVLGITNHLVVKPAVTTPDVKQRVEAALRRNAEVEAGNIRIDVEDNVVTLDGRVANRNELIAAERAAWAAPGVQDVVVRLAIG